MEQVSQFVEGLGLPILLKTGMLIFVAFWLGQLARKVKLPSLIGYMVTGLVFGHSFLGMLNDQTVGQLSFITEIALGFVALSIGLELKLSALKKLGMGIVWIILFESFGAFVLVTLSIWLLTDNWPLALIFGAIAPASAPAGTVAIIQEYRARGPLTRALYAVVGFDDGLGIIIFGFAAAIARSLLLQQAGAEVPGLWHMLADPMREVGLSLVVGGAFAVVFILVARAVRGAGDNMILVFALVLAVCGVCTQFHLSLILTNMVVGMLIVNTQPHHLVQRIHDRLPTLMPLLFVLFFTLAGANLHVSQLPALGVVGIVYVLTRSAGLIFGSRLGAMIGRTDATIRNWVGLGILSQAGVAIGLSLIVLHEFGDLGIVTESGQTMGAWIGSVVITTITATCIFFEIIGPILTRIALTKAGEIGKGQSSS